MYSPQTLLSQNSKTGVSLNLPIQGHCTPTKNCSFCCYGRVGRTKLPDATRKAAYVSEYLSGSTDLSRLANECQQYTAVRLSGVGELLESHIPNVLKLAKICPNTVFWGMTRKLPIAYALQNIPNIKFMVSVDSSSPAETWTYTGSPLCFGPRLATDQVPSKSNILTVFPYHFTGKVLKGMPHHEKDCPAVWHTISGCHACGRCWKW